jgi:capsular exopolysaccharide synthesis family protein
VASEQYPQLDARAIGHALWRWLWLIVAMVVGAFVLTYGVSRLQSKVYSASADVHVATSSKAINPGGLKSGDPTLMGNEIYAVKSPAVRSGVNKAIGNKSSQILGVRASNVANTDVLHITVSSHSPDAARDAANAYANSYFQVRSAQLAAAPTATLQHLATQKTGLQNSIDSLTNQINADPRAPNAAALSAQRSAASQSLAAVNTAIAAAQGSQADAQSALSIVKTAGRPSVPDSPTPVRDAGIAAIVALVLGIGLALLLEQLDNRVKTPEEITRITDGVQVLGSIPEYGTKPHRFSRRFHPTERALVSPTSAAAESYHSLATNLRFSNFGKEKRTILVTSTLGGEGKTTVTANLAAVLAESGFRVVVVSADLRRPMLGELLHVAETEKGLTSAMMGERELAACFVSVPLPSGKNIFVLPSGPLPHEPAVLLGSDAFGVVLEQIKRSQADFILIDCAPVLPVSDPVAASRHVDGIIILALHDQTRRGDLTETVDRLHKVDADIIGVVLNGVPVRRGRFGYYGYYGYADYGSYAARKPRGTNGDSTTAETAPTNGHSKPPPPPPPEKARVDEGDASSTSS